LVARHRRQNPPQCETLPQPFVDFWAGEIVEAVSLAEHAAPFVGQLPPLSAFGWAAMRGYIQAKQTAEEDQRKADEQQRKTQELQQMLGR
jgi:hypothetical protein